MFYNPQMPITRRPARNDPDAIPLSIIDLAPWDADPTDASSPDQLLELRHASETSLSPVASATPRDRRTSRPDRRPVAAPRPVTRSRTPESGEPSSTDTGAALSRAFGALASRAHTVRDMGARLGRAGFAAEAVDGAVTRLQDLGYLNDATFADAWVATRRANRLHGTMRLRYDLARHGVDGATIDSATVDDGNEEARATAVAARAVRSLASADRATAMRRLAGLLTRRGFPARIVSRVVRATLDEWAKGTSGAHEDTTDDDLPEAG